MFQKIFIEKNFPNFSFLIFNIPYFENVIDIRNVNYETQQLSPSYAEIDGTHNQR